MTKGNTLIFFISLTITQAFAQDIMSKLRMKEGNEAYNSGEFIQSNDLYSQSFKNDTSNLKAAFNNGNSSFMSGDFESSRNNFNQYLQSNITKEEKSKAYYNIGNSYLTEYAKSAQENTGQSPNSDLLTNAVDNYKKSLRNNPTDEDARYNLSYAMKLLQQSQNQDQQNKDQQNKDQQNKDQQNKDQQNKDQQNKDQQNKDQQNKDQQNKNQQQKEKQAQSKQQALKNLDAINGDEEKILMKVNRNKGDKKKKSKTKDW
ncbi:MAG: hypothetical protein VXY69_03035 [Bacteroidota bacterium]|nr:hypothetical protein [Bacteroidota bacterium]